MVDQLLPFLITGQQAPHFLSKLFEHREKPKSINCDNGAELASKAMFF